MFASAFFQFFFFFTRFWDLRLLFMHCNCKVGLFKLCQSVHIVYCSRTYKFYFSVTFSLKMGPTILFTHLKIILLQCFSVSIFSFQLYPNGSKCYWQSNTCALSKTLNSVWHCTISKDNFTWIIIFYFGSLTDSTY